MGECLVNDEQLLKNIFSRGREDFERHTHYTRLERPTRLRGTDAEPYSSPPSEFILPSEEFEESDRFKARWKHVQVLSNRFWQRWMKEYLPTLEERQKWLHSRPNFQVGDLVLMADKNVLRGQCPKALVEQVFPDSEGTSSCSNRRWSLPPRHAKAVYVGRAVVQLP